MKNKVAPPFKTAEFDIMYNEGISMAGDLIDTGVKYEVVKKSGNTYALGEMKLGVGREAAKKFIRETPKVVSEILKAIKGKLKE
jgi:recombination protein RecA